MIIKSLRQLIYDHSGLKLDETRHTKIDDTLKQMQQEAGLDTPDDLLTLLASLPTTAPLWQTLVDRVTIGETYFFRNRYHFSALREHVLPALIKKRRDQNFLHLNLWSSGCATGEEPYSLAMLLDDLLPDRDQWTISISGTDINATSLERARTGIYRSNSFRTETPGNLAQRYFIQHGNEYHLDPAIKRMVTFTPLNLITDVYPSFHTRTLHQDLIICRNVTIYFDEVTTKQVVGRFWQSLTNGGWLLVGHSEPIASTYDAFTAHNFDNAILYQKEAPDISVTTSSPASTRKKTRRQPTTRRTSRTTSAAPGRAERSTQSRTPITLESVKDAVNREEWSTALAALAVLEQRSPMEPEVHYLRGIVLMHSGELDSARNALRKSLYCDPSFALAHYTLGEIHIQQGHTQEALRCWTLSERAVAGLQPDKPLTAGDDLTVEMFRDMLHTRLATLNKKDNA